VGRSDERGALEVMAAEVYSPWRAGAWQRWPGVIWWKHWLKLESGG
jgi:hypothetical protein